ncbi:glyoxalase [Oceanicola sp. 22II-s10i]|uniref:VOC family protein n=1 Tax=Oceanicola sp. 22II-s10i TaxID=1317116 RepID=UPI000B51FED5|nr:VOC family protein [Oceanicola sp. 22II-s10i]OWU85423.1 glyoxalase [Oceanicola sp. 22II-s10i]
MTIRLEHANITVTDPKATAAWLERVFGWKTRWEGPAMQTGHTVHIGTDDSYIALFGYGDAARNTQDTYRTVGLLNHLAVFTDEDIDAVAERVKEAGFEPGNFNDYAPGRRFYFHDSDGIEWEVASHQH